MLPDDNPTPLKKQRRRNAQSEWERVLQQRRNAITLRQQLPLPLSTAYRTGSSATPLDTNNIPEGQFEDPALDDDTLLPTSNLRQALAQGSTQEHNESPSSHVDRLTGILPPSERAALTSTASQGSAQNITEHRDQPASRNDVCGSRHRPENGSDHADIETLQSMIECWRNNSTLSALCATVGSVRYTVRQYEYSRNQLRDHEHNGEHIWPSYYRIRRTFDQIRDRCLPESSVVYLPKHRKPAMRDSTNRSGAATGDTIANADMEPVRVFFPTAWARMDIATSTVFNQMYPDGGGQELDTSSLTLKRHTITDPCTSIFADCDGEVVRCGRGSIIRISAQRSKPNHSTPIDVYDSGDQHYFDARITAVWCVGTEPDLTSSGEMALSTQELPTNEKYAIKTLLTSRTLSTGLTGIVRPGDICSMLSAERQCEIDEYLPILIHRYWRSHDGMPSITVVWICPSQYGGRATPPSSHPEHGEGYIVSTVFLREQGVEDNDIRGTQGRLNNGTPYVVIRVYYTGVSTNDVLHFIVDDLVHGTVCGIWGYTPRGQRVRIFLDVVGFIGDYPASSAVTDVIGHIGRSPCTHCSFRRLHREEAEGSRFGYTTNIHAENSAFLRSAERHYSLRNAGIDSEDATKLGLSQSSIHDVEHWPLNHLSAALQRHRYRIPLSQNGKLVVTGKLDPYRSNFVAPDHLLTGLAKDVLNTVFQSLPNAYLQNRVDVYICTALRRNGLLPQRETFNKKKKEIHSMSLSELYCVLLVSGPCFRVVTAQYQVQPHTRDAISLLNILQKLVALTYWWPQRNIDGIRAETFVRVNPSAYFKELKRLAANYIRLVDAFCAKSEIGRKYLDKPNLHRILELYHHSIPAFGHVREFMELIFESVHQNLKRSIEGSNNHDIQIYAVEQCAANDWQGRIASLYRETKQRDKKRELLARRGLRRILLGPEADLLHEERDKDFIRDADATIDALFEPTLVHYLNKDSLISNFAATRKSIWKASDQITAQELSNTLSISDQLLPNVIKTAKTWIDTLFPTFHPTTDGTTSVMKVFKTCRRVKRNEDELQMGSINAFDTLTCNDVMHVYLHEELGDEKVLQYQPGSETKPAFFIFVAALHRSRDLVWAICQRCKRTGDRIQSEGEFNKETFQILCLTNEVRRVATYHVCSPTECIFDIERKTISHSATALGGAVMYFQRRVNGYPPRVA